MFFFLSKAFSRDHVMSLESIGHSLQGYDLRKRQFKIKIKIKIK
jgi:hypothetical protein